MKFRIGCVFVAFLTVALSMAAQTPSSAAASVQVPPVIQFSNVATDAGGTPLSGAVEISFSLYTNSVGGNPLWAETQNVTLDNAGHYSVYVGITKPNGVPMSLFTSGQAHWLGVQIAGQAEQARVFLVSVPYAMKAADAATIGGLPPSAFVLAAPLNYVPAETAGSSVERSDLTGSRASSDVTTTGGTMNTLPLFSSTTNIQNSILTQTGSGTTGKIGINTATPATTLDVNGGATIRGTLTAAVTGTATAAKGFDSQPLGFVASVFNSSSATAVPQKFQWQAEPAGNDTTTASGTLNLLYASGSATPAETGLRIGAKGIIAFAAGQTFPGAGGGTITGVTAGTALTGGGTTGKVTLNVDTTKVPLLVANNTFTGTQTINGGPLGIGTTSPRSLIEVVKAPPGPLGPTLTLTHSAVSGAFGGSTVDFNTYLPSTTGTYNPSSRIEAFGDGGYGDSLWFLSNNDSASAGPNQGLTLNMVIGSNGRVNIGTQDTDINDYAEQLVITSVPLEGNGEVAAIGAFGEAVSNATDSNGSNGVYAFGGDGVGNAQADFAGDGGEFFGGFTPESSSGPAGYGIYAAGGVGGVGVAAYAGYFDGDINVTGTVFGAAKDFKIDHPLDPANKYLVHAAVESSEMVNLYSGNVVTDELGSATVALPGWFQAENGDFRYQLTVIGGRFAQAVVSKEIANNQFVISTNAPNVKVSWQVTAVRQDAYAKAHPIVVEQTKPAFERGLYEHPELYGQPREKQTEWAHRRRQMERTRTLQEKRRLAPANAARTFNPQLKPINQIDSK